MFKTLVPVAFLLVTAAYPAHWTSAVTQATLPATSVATSQAQSAVALYTQRFDSWQRPNQPTKHPFTANDPLGYLSANPGLAGVQCVVDCGNGRAMTCAGDLCTAFEGGCWVKDDGEEYYWYC